MSIDWKAAASAALASGAVMYWAGPGVDPRSDDAASTKTVPQNEQAPVDDRSVCAGEFWVDSVERAVPVDCRTKRSLSIFPRNQWGRDLKRAEAESSDGF